MNQREERTRDLRKLSQFLDSQFELPLGIKIGWDAIIGMIPGLGDMITNLMSFYIIWRGAMLGCPPSVVIRMGLNLLIANLVDMVPFLGPIADMFWKSNLKNLDLIERHLDSPVSTVNSSRGVVLGVLTLLGAGLIGITALAITLAMWLFELLKSAL